MYSKAKIAGSPIHAMLVGFPITFYFVTFFSFLFYQTASNDTFWFKLGYFSTFAAIFTALLAAIPGTIDWAFGIPKGTVAKKHGRTHMILNLITLALYSVTAILTGGNWDNPNISLGAPLFLTGIGCLITVSAGYYGWDLVARHKVGVQMSPDQEHLQERYEQQEPPLFH